MKYVWIKQRIKEATSGVQISKLCERLYYHYLLSKGHTFDFKFRELQKGI